MLNREKHKKPPKSKLDERMPGREVPQEPRDMFDNTIEKEKVVANNEVIKKNKQSLNKSQKKM